ncbi:dihydrofolate reductase family protein [Actinomadura viridis]|uniref:Dihydrofolate reductase n=1 Tax=Actinomadura viridis TaxID=58110 RepID=A0A931GJF8_9ACTN|nr:dihydrofolate reductase family protein [Actinomadura viridis]MBG6089132.1 dihydrofolate reductase [Actinomadura viridis]
MRKLTAVEFLSVDGVMQGYGSPGEDTSGGFRHGGWAAHFAADDELMAANAEGLSATGAYLFGRRTYEKMAAFWPTGPSDVPFTSHLNNTPKYVASTTLREVTWQKTFLLEGDVPEAVTKLKHQEGGDIVILGSGMLVRTLMGHDLVDRFTLLVHPLLLGSGKRLFPDDQEMRRLRLIDSRTTRKGTVVLGYQPA